MVRQVTRITRQFCAAATELAQGLFTQAKAICNCVGQNPAWDAVIDTAKIVWIALAEEGNRPGHTPNIPAPAFAI
jgi:hypothetical protein